MGPWQTLQGPSSARLFPEGLISQEGNPLVWRPPGLRRRAHLGLATGPPGRRSVHPASLPVATAHVLPDANKTQAESALERGLRGGGGPGWSPPAAPGPSCARI